MAFAALSGILLMLTARGVLPGIAACFALIPLCLSLCRAETPLKAGGLTFVAQLGILISAYEGAIPAVPWTFPILLLLAAPAAMFPGVLYRLLRTRFPPAWASPTTVSLWSLPFSWTAAEFLAGRREIWGQFASPVALGYTQFDSPLMNLASFGGVTALTLAILVMNVASTSTLRPMGLAALPLTAVVVVGLVVIGSAGSIDRDRRPTATVGLVQPALEPHWYELAPALASARRVIFERLFALSQEVRQADLIVWPEGALPAGSGQLPRNIGADGGTPRTILAGAVTHVGGSRFNSVVHLSEGGSETVFNKLALVPVGEAGFTPGSSLAVGDWGGIWSAPLICLDSLYPQFTRRLARLGAEVLIVVSDDSFAQRMATPQLHLRASAFRAVETGLPLVFVSAHGPSAVVGPRGEVLARTEFGEPDALIADIPAPEPETFYVRYGDFVGFISLVVTICLVLLLARDPARLSRY